MPATPDSTFLAKRLLNDIAKAGGEARAAAALIVGHLRAVWNDHGDAERRALEPILGANMDDEIRAIRTLDR